jgi:uncharacterized membrane protein
MTLVRRVPAAALPSIVAILAIGLLALLPDLGPRVVSENLTVEAHHGRIREILVRAPDEPIRPPFATVELLDGSRAGEVVQAYLEGPGGSQIVANYQPGDEVVVTFSHDQEGQVYIAVSDRWRAPLLGAVLLIFAVAVVVVGGLRGARALLSLGLTIAVVLKVLIPLVLNGVAPVPLAVVTATLITVVTIVLTEGWTRASAAAILGTAAALALTGLLAAAATMAAGFTYSAGSDLAFLSTADGRGLDLRGLLLAAFILGTVGVLDDVTVTQAALVDSLAARGTHGAELVRAALDVGRSHIAATVNTLFMAYVGAGLPLLVTILVSQQPAALTLNSEDVATEVIRTVVGSLGILAAVPFTTFVAAAIVDRPADARGSRRSRRAIGVATGLTVVALLAAAVLPLGSGRAALPRDSFGPLPSASAITGEVPSGPGPSVGPGPSARSREPEILAADDPFALTAGGTSVEVVVTSVDAVPTSDGTRVTVELTYRNEGPSEFAPDRAAWHLLASSGEDIPMLETAPGSFPTAPLAAGETSTGALTGTVHAGPDDTFVTFLDDLGELLFVVAANGS